MDNDTRSNKKEKINNIEKLDFNKVIQQKIPYSVFMNSVIQQINNTDALAIYVYLYSLPPNWHINKEHLANKFQLGDKKLRSIFSYLNRSGLLEYRKEKNKKTGQMEGTIIHLLNGEKFDSTVLFKIQKTSLKPTQAKIASLDKSSLKPTQAIPDPVENRPCGREGLQKKEKYKVYKSKKETKRFSAQNQKTNEPKQTAKFWEPGNPDYDRANGIK
jgi:hypothetical protein